MWLWDLASERRNPWIWSICDRVIKCKGGRNEHLGYSPEQRLFRNGQRIVKRKRETCGPFFVFRFRQGNLESLVETRKDGLLVFKISNNWAQTKHSWRKKNYYSLSKASITIVFPLKDWWLAKFSHPTTSIACRGSGYSNPDGDLLSVV